MRPPANRLGTTAREARVPRGGCVGGESGPASRPDPIGLVRAPRGSNDTLSPGCGIGFLARIARNPRAVKANRGYTRAQNWHRRSPTAEPTLFAAGGPAGASSLAERLEAVTDPAPLPYVHGAPTIATFEPGMYDVVETFVAARG